MRKFFLLSGAFFLLAIIAVVVVLLSPAVHKAVFLWAAKGRVDEVSVDYVRFTLSSMEINELNLSYEGVKLSTDHALVKASWIDVARSKQVRLDDVVIHGLKADLVTLAAASGGGLGAWLDMLGTTEDPSDEPWQGILAMMKPSNLVAIDRARIDGKVLLPEQRVADVNLALDDLELGKLARIKMQGGFLDEGGTTPVDRATYDLELELDQTVAGEMNGVTGKLILELVGNELNPRGKIGVNGIWNLARTADGEVISILLREDGKTAPVFITEMNTNVESGDINGRLETNLNGALLPVDLLELPSVIGTATLSTRGDVGWNYKTGAGQFSLEGSGVLEQRPWQYQLSGRGTAQGLPAIKGYLKTGFSDEDGPGDLTVNLDMNTSGDGQVTVPVEVRRGNRLSRLTLQTVLDSFQLTPFDIHLSGETIYVGDLQSVGKALAAWGYSMQQLDTVTEQAAGIAKEANDSGVPWEGLSGKADLTIHKLVLPQGYSLDGLNAETSVRPDSVALSSFSSRIATGSIQAKGVLLYTDNSETPFTFRAEGAVHDLPSGLVDLGSGAPITGSWDGTVAVIGQARQVEQLADAIQISLDVEGSAGVLQMTRIDEGANQKAQILNLGLSLFGGQDGRLGAVSQMTQYLQRVPYDSIRLVVDRYPSGQVAIQDFTIQGPELLLTGSGTVHAQSWVTLAEGALQMNLTMGTKGSFGRNANTLGLTGDRLSGEYQLWRQPINISGTLGNPNYSALKDLIFNALR